MKNDREKNYVSPQIEVLEIQVEQAILTSSLPDYEFGGDPFGN
jgi:hypothetical protein